MKKLYRVVIVMTLVAAVSYLGAAPASAGIVEDLCTKWNVGCTSCSVSVSVSAGRSGDWVAGAASGRGSCNSSVEAMTLTVDVNPGPKNAAACTDCTSIGTQSGSQAFFAPNNQQVCFMGFAHLDVAKGDVFVPHKSNFTPPPGVCV